MRNITFNARLQNFTIGGKAAEDGRTPRRWRDNRGPAKVRQVLECGCPLPLSCNLSQHPTVRLTQVLLLLIGRAVWTPRFRAKPPTLALMPLILVAVCAIAFQSLAAERPPNDTKLETRFFRFTLVGDTGCCTFLDKRTGVSWLGATNHPRFGGVTLQVGGKPRRVDLNGCSVESKGKSLVASFHPLSEQPAATLRVRLQALPDQATLDVSYQADEALQVTSISLLEDLLGATDAGKGYVIVPVREGLLVPADSGLSFTHRFGTFEYEGCHMEMLGMVQGGAAVMVTWHDPYVAAELKSVVAETPSSAVRQRLSASLVLAKSAKSFRIRLLGQGDYVTIGKAYRKVAQEKGWLVTWDEKLKDHPERAKLFGAINYKLWSTLDRRMNAESTKEESVRVNWTFDEAAQVAEHLKHDLKLDRRPLHHGRLDTSRL